MTYEIAQKSILGKRREQQDSFFIHTEKEKVFSAVCDGMGGCSNGQAASMVVSETMKRLYLSKATDESYTDFFIKSIDILDEKVLSLRDSDSRNISSGTTILTVAIEGNSLYWLSVGDSRLYIIRNENIARVTRDHNYFLSLNKLVENGTIDTDKYKDEASKGEQLISYIGMGGVLIFDVNDAPFKLMPQDAILLCTDGLYRAVSDDEILHIVNGHNSKETVCALIDESNKIYFDNTTCILIKYQMG